jgi:hypothetical protein
MVDINTKLHFNDQESQLLEMAANLGGRQPTDEDIKTILLNAARSVVNRFAVGVLDAHHNKTYPPTPITEERRLMQRRTKLEDDLAKTNAALTNLRSLRLKPVKS